MKTLKAAVKTLIRNERAAYAAFFREDAKDLGISLKDYHEEFIAEEVADELEFFTDILGLIKGRWLQCKSKTIEDLKVEVEAAYDAYNAEMKRLYGECNRFTLLYNEDWCIEFFWEKLEELTTEEK